MKKLLMIMPLVILLCFTFGRQQGEETAAGEELKAKVRQEIDEAWNMGNVDVLDNFTLLIWFTTYPPILILWVSKPINNSLKKTTQPFPTSKSQS